MREWIDLFENQNMHLSEYQGSGLLYHGTDILGLGGIMADDKITKSIDQEGSLAGVSLTHGEGTAWEFADRSTYIFEGNHHAVLRDIIPGYSGVPMTGAVVALNADKLRRAYKLLHYWDDTFFQDDEEEVRVMTAAIQPLSAYIEWFSCRPADLEWFAAYMLTEYAAREHGGGVDAAAHLRALASHPRFKPYDQN